MQQVNLKFLILSLLSIFLFSGCSFSKIKNDLYNITSNPLTESTDFSNIASNLIINLSPSISSLKENEPLYVIDFVNLKQLENNSELGFILSSEVKTLVTQKCNKQIYEIEFAKYLKLGRDGSKLLSRDVTEIQNKQLSNTSYALVGTYAFTQNKVIVYLKLIDLSNGVILKSSTVQTALTNEIILLEQKNSKINMPLKRIKPILDDVKATNYQYSPLVL